MYFMFVLTRLDNLSMAGHRISPGHVQTEPSILCCKQNKKIKEDNAAIVSGLSHKQLLLSTFPSFVRQYGRKRNIRSEFEEKETILLAYW